ncbi:MAG: TlpA family protein disulfide reductase [Planctomycetota bacterium]|jgi:thiol-disulfide isomerase/thioredoxin
MQKCRIIFLISLLILTSSQAIGRPDESVQSEKLLPSLIASDKYSVQLNDQVQIDLLAVSNPVWQLRWQVENKVQPINGRKPEYWWRPDGKRFERAPFQRKYRTFGSYHFDFLIRIKGIDDDYSVFAGHKDPAKLNQVEIQPAVDIDRKPLTNLFIIRGRSFPQRGRIEKANLKVGLTYGPWSHVESWELDWPKWAKNRDYVLSSECGALIEIPQQVGNDIHVDLAHRLVHEEIRLVATDQQDQVHVAALTNRGNGDGISRRLCVFKDLSLKQLKTISVEKRSYHWIEFPDVIIEPDHVLDWTSYSAIKKQKGQEAPEFCKIKGWKNSRPMKMSELRGKVVLLDFWNYACWPCIKEMPKLMDLHERYSDNGLVVIGIHADLVESIEEMEQKLAKYKEKSWKGRDMLFPVALDGGGKTLIKGTNKTTIGATTAAYGVLNFPTKILINKDGKLLGEFFINTDDYEQQIKKLLELGETKN